MCVMLVILGALVAEVKGAQLPKKTCTRCTTVHKVHKVHKHKVHKWVRI